MKFSFKNSLTIIEIIILLINYILNVVLSQVLSDSSDHKIERSHSNSIPSFDDSIYYKINWFPNQFNSQDSNHNQDSDQNDPKVIIF